MIYKKSLKKIKDNNKKILRVEKAFPKLCLEPLNKITVSVEEALNRFLKFEMENCKKYREYFYIY